MSEKTTKRKCKEKQSSKELTPPNENYYESSKKELSSYLDNIKNLINNNDKKEQSSLLEKLNSIFLQINNLFEKLLAEYSQYESRTKLNEQIIRKLHSDVFFEKTANECLENKMAKLIQKQTEFEEIKEKMGVIFCDGQIIHNERKENEILILRTENSNLKNYIEKSEQNIKKKDNEINALNQKISIINKEIQKLKQNKETIHIKSPHIGQSFSNININFNEIKEINNSRVLEKKDSTQKSNDEKYSTLFQTFSSKLNPNPPFSASSKQKYLNVRSHNKHVSKEKDTSQLINKNNYELNSTDNNINKFITVKKINANPLSTRLLKKKKYLNFRTVSQELNLQINQTSKNMDNKKLLYGKIVNNKIPINSASYLNNFSKNNEEITTFCNSTRNNNKHEIVMTDRDSKIPKIKFPSKYLDFKKDGELTKNSNRVFHKKNNSSMFQMSVMNKKSKK